MPSSPPIAVAAATSHLGTLAVDELVARVGRGQVIAIARDPAKAAGLAGRGIAVRYADYRDPAALREVLRGVGRLLLISSGDFDARIEQHQNVVDAAVAAGVSFVGYTSITAAATSPALIAVDHKATEDALHAAGIPFCSMRNNWYLENYAGEVEAARAAGEIASATGDGRVHAATRADYAAGHAAVVADAERHHNAIYEFGCDVGWTMDDLASALAQLLGKSVVHRRLDPDARAEQFVRDGMPEDVAKLFVASETDTANGLMDVDGSALGRILERQTTSLADGLRPFVAG